MYMLVSYQLKIFESFDRKGNLKQHVARFVETYNNLNTKGDFLVKQFVRSYWKNTFNWYIDLVL